MVRPSWKSTYIMKRWIMIYVSAYLVVSVLMMLAIYNVLSKFTPEEALGYSGATNNKVQLMTVFASLIWPLFLVIVVFSIIRKVKGNNE